MTRRPLACLPSRSVDFLKRTGRTADLDFILNHIDDLHSVFTVRGGEVLEIPRDQPLVPLRLPTIQFYAET